MDLPLYSLPFKQYCNHHYVYDANDNFIFQFENRQVDVYEEPVEYCKYVEEQILNALNGKSTDKFLDELELEIKEDFEDCSIYNRGKLFITIRGWGNLTSESGFNLTNQDAGKIQNEFAKWIVWKLTEGRTKN